MSLLYTTQHLTVLAKSKVPYTPSVILTIGYDNANAENTVRVLTDAVSRDGDAYELKMLADFNEAVENHADVAVLEVDFPALLNVLMVVSERHPGGKVTYSGRALANYVKSCLRQELFFKLNDTVTGKTVMVIQIPKRYLRSRELEIIRAVTHKGITNRTGLNLRRIDEAHEATSLVDAGTPLRTFRGLSELVSNIGLNIMGDICRTKVIASLGRQVPKDLLSNALTYILEGDGGKMKVIAGVNCTDVPHATLEIIHDKFVRAGYVRFPHYPKLSTENRLVFVDTHKAFAWIRETCDLTTEDALKHTLAQEALIK